MSPYPLSLPDDTQTMKLKRQNGGTGPFAPDVPQEIVDLIIDNLQDDPLALRSCALTAHNWVHRSRRHLHSLVRIGEYYVNLRRYASPPVAQYVRSLDLYMVRTDRGRQRTTTESLWKMVARFQNLRSLVIRDFEFYRLSPRRSEVLLNICSRLRSLELRHVHFADPADFLSLVGACPQLRALLIEDGHFYSSITRSRAEEQTSDYLEGCTKHFPGSGLQSLTVGGLNSCYHFETAVDVWVSELTRRGFLRELTLSKDSPDDCEDILRAVGSSAIDLRIARCHTRAEKPARTGIEHCTNIRALSFVTSLVNSPRRSNPAWVIHFLQQLPSPTGSPARTPPPLRSLAFELHWSDKDSVDVDFLTEVDHILSSRQDAFGGLAEVVFAVHRHLSPKLQLMETPAGSLPERTLAFKMFLRVCLGTHLKGLVARKGCSVKLVFPNDGDVLRVEARKFGEECKH
ncbi:hypothetical protein EIP91_005772 [Steccherinum ochraceum]|uniref:F-box domain-containing protein n=1 Tax=Steccherinum ochraceum TaxID=92696 RepID=A0A4R0R731_9APHY|nr:hypothetical protein EIP91_005772 [Steccherinum ochraceum]